MKSNNKLEVNDRLPMIVSMLGHKQVAAYVSMHEWGNLLRLDVPIVKNNGESEVEGYEVEGEWMKVINPNSIYEMDLVSEEVMLFKAMQLKVRPMAQWDIRTFVEMEKRNAVPSLSAGAGEQEVCCSDCGEEACEMELADWDGEGEFLCDDCKPF